VTFNAASGLLSGTPTASGSFTLTFTAHNAVGPDATQSFTLTVNAASTVTLSSLSLNPANVAGGSSSTATVKLSGAAPSGGAVVTLTSGTTSVATVPPSVTVAAGATTATFTVTTVSVSSSTPVTISGNYNAAQSAILTVNPATTTALSTVTVSPTSVTAPALSTGTVRLSAVAPTGGIVVSLSSSVTSAATVPASVSVAAGATTATFSVTTIPVAASTAVVISGTYNGVAKTATLTVRPPAALSVTLTQATVVGGTSLSGIVTLNAIAPASGALVTLASNTPSAATVPASITVPAGATNTTFPVTTLTTLTVPVSVTISAVAGGTTRTAALRVEVPVAPNLATTATVTVSSENASTGQQRTKAIDGIVDGSPPPGDYTKEWATNGQLAGAWLRLTWSGNTTVSQVVLYDRINLTDNITSATLTFSDGSSVTAGALPNNGTPLTVSFVSKTVTWVQVTVNSAVGQNIGLAEIAVH
jgi:hypothetical protein